MKAKIGYLHYDNWYDEDNEFHEDSHPEFKTEKPRYSNGKWIKIVYFEVEDNE